MYEPIPPSGRCRPLMSCKRARPGAGSVPTATVLGWALPRTQRPITRGWLTKRPPLPRLVSALMCPANGPLESRVCTYRNRPRLGPASNTNPTSHHAGLSANGPLVFNMAVTVSAGLQKKVGLPDYGSLGASCHVEFEIDRSMLDQNLDGFHQKVADAFAACRQAE